MSMKPLNLDQQIQLARVLGHLSMMIEGDAHRHRQQEYLRRTAAELCPFLDLDHPERALDDLWELAGIREGGMLEKDVQELPEKLSGLAAPLRRKAVGQ